MKTPNPHLFRADPNSKSQRALALYNEGHTQAEACRIVGCSQALLSRMLSKKRAAKTAKVARQTKVHRRLPAYNKSRQRVIINTEYIRELLKSV